MLPAGAPSRREARLLLGAVGAIALLAVVAIATRGGFGRHQTAAPSTSYVNYAYTVFLIVFALMIPVAIRAFLLEAREGLTTRPSFLRRLLRNIGAILFFGALGLVYFTLEKHRLSFGLRAHRAAQPGGGSAASTKRITPAFQWPVAWIALVALLAAGWYGLSRRRSLLSLLPRVTTHLGAPDLRATIDDAIDDLEAEPDARRAVIAAYARMERALGLMGLPRDASETPVEYLRRILLRQTTSADAVRHLTELFGRARFSQHPIGVESKREAIDALQAIRAGLPAR